MKKASPISYAQQGVYIDCVIDPENLRYNNPKAIVFEKKVTSKAVVEALAKVLECHPALFSHFEEIEGKPMQVFAEECHAEVTLRQVSASEADAAKASFVRLFDIGHGPLYRAEVLDAPTEVLLLIDFHHLVYDGVSLNIIMQELCSLLNGIEPSLESNSYAAYAEAQQANTALHKAYFDSLFSEGVTPTHIPEDLGTEEGSHEEYVHLLSTTDTISKAKALGTAPSALFMASAFYTLSRYVNSKNLCITTISSGRQNPLSQGVVGMFVNTLPLVCNIKDETVREFIHVIREMFQQMRQHEEYP
ncbi:MAG: hypothetical protein KBS95_08555, partial [Alistipes sp.]|nr:hypothetical protein [Candidatus Alistipes equi]